jgi:hypothetical protein
VAEQAVDIDSSMSTGVARSRRDREGASFGRTHIAAALLAERFRDVVSPAAFISFRAAGFSAPVPKLLVLRDVAIKYCLGAEYPTQITCVGGNDYALFIGRASIPHAFQ